MMDDFEHRASGRRLASVKIIDSKEASEPNAFVYLKFILQAYVPLIIDLGSSGVDPSVQSGQAQVRGNKVLVSGDEETILTLRSSVVAMKDPLDGENFVHSMIRCDEQTLESAMPHKTKIPREPVAIASDEIIPAAIYSAEGKPVGRAVYHASSETLYSDTFSVSASVSAGCDAPDFSSTNCIVFDDEDVSINDGIVTRNSLSLGDAVQVYFGNIHVESVAGIPTATIANRVMYMLRDSKTGVPIFNRPRKLAEKSYVNKDCKVVASFEASGLPLHVECPTASTGRPYVATDEPLQDMGSVVINAGDDTLLRKVKLVVVGSKTGAVLPEDREYKVSLKNEDSDESFTVSHGIPEYYFADSEPMKEEEETILPVGVYKVENISSPEGVRIDAVKYGVFSFSPANASPVRLTVVADGNISLCIPEEDSQYYIPETPPSGDKTFEKSVYVEMCADKVSSSGNVTTKCMEDCADYADVIKKLDRVLLGPFHFDSNGTPCLLSRPLNVQHTDDPFAMNLKRSINDMITALKEDKTNIRLDPVFGCCKERGNDSVNLFGPSLKTSLLEMHSADDVTKEIASAASSALAVGVAQTIVFFGGKVRRPVFNVSRVSDIPMALKVIAGAMQRLQTTGLVEYDIMLGARAIDELCECLGSEIVYCGGAPKPKSAFVIFSYLDGEKSEVEKHVLSVSKTCSIPVKFTVDTDCETEPYLLPKHANRHRRTPTEIGNITRERKFAGTCIQHLSSDEECWNTPMDDAVALDIPVVKPLFTPQREHHSPSTRLWHKFVKSNVIAKNKRSSLNPYPQKGKKEWKKTEIKLGSDFKLNPHNPTRYTFRLNPRRDLEGCGGSYKFVINKQGNIAEAKRYRSDTPMQY